MIILLSLSLLLSACTNLVYWPDRVLHADPQTYGIKYEEFSVQSNDGTKLVAWDLKSTTANPENLILMFHGNAQNLSAHAFNLTWMLEKKSDLLVFDYRGYGLSEGSPYPKGMVEDGLTFLELAYEKFKAGHYKHFIIYAQSLGGAIALRALEEIPWKNEISLLVLDSTFISPQDVAKSKTHGMLGWLISSEYTAAIGLTHITMPLLVIHSPEDPVIPYKFGTEIFAQAPSLKKTFWKIDGGGHGDVFTINKGANRAPFIELINNTK